MSAKGEKKPKLVMNNCLRGKILPQKKSEKYSSIWKFSSQNFIMVGGVTETYTTDKFS